MRLAIWLGAALLMGCGFGDNSVHQHDTCGDDGNRTSGDGCSDACKLEPASGPKCGDGKVDAGEECDDGNTASGDGCSPTCKREASTACSLIPQGSCSDSTPACDLTSA